MNLQPVPEALPARAAGRTPLEEQSRDYRRMEATLEWLLDNFESQPSLAQIADHAGLAPFHFQRTFSRWVGLSPKKFVQFLCLDHARRSLDASRSVLDAAMDAGLSGAGRLHDLFVNLHAMTPGEYKRRGEGLLIRYGFHPSPFGECLVLATERGVCGMAFVTGGDRRGALESQKRGWESARFETDAALTADLTRRIFAPAVDLRDVPPLNVIVRGSRFQVRVWEALLRVPPGTVVSYSALAAHLGRPDAVRAVAGAVAGNAVAYLIPCHRVIRKSGLLGGYRWGPPRKLAMLSREAARLEVADVSF